MTKRFVTFNQVILFICCITFNRIKIQSVAMGNNENNPKLGLNVPTTCTIARVTDQHHVSSEFLPKSKYGAKFNPTHKNEKPHLR